MNVRRLTAVVATGLALVAGGVLAGCGGGSSAQRAIEANDELLAQADQAQTDLQVAQCATLISLARVTGPDTPVGADAYGDQCASPAVVAAALNSLAPSKDSATWDAATMRGLCAGDVSISVDSPANETRVLCRAMGLQWGGAK